MATATSHIEACCEWLVTNLKSNATIASQNTDPRNPAVLVVNGPPGQYEPLYIVSVGEKIEQSYTPHALVGSMGSAALLEEFLISVNVSALLPSSSDGLTARQKCMTISAAVDDTVRNDPTMGGNAFLTIPVRHLVEVSWDDERKGWYATDEIELQVRATP